LVLPCISWTKHLMVNAWLMVRVLLTNSVLFHGCCSNTDNCKGPAFNQTFYSFIIQYMTLKSFPNVNKNVCFNKQKKLKNECSKYCLVLLWQIAVLSDEQNLASWCTYANTQLQFSADSCIIHDVSLKLQYAR